MSSLCSVQLLPTENATTVSELQVFMVMQLMEKRLRSGMISVAQILTPEKMYSANIADQDIIQWTEASFSDDFNEVTNEIG